jgi:molybdate transport system substrate-binding protein
MFILATVSYDGPTCDFCVLSQSPFLPREDFVRLRILYSVVLALVMVVLGYLDGGARATQTGAVRVAAATDLKFALEELMKEFRQQRPDIRVQITYGSSGKFYPQLSNRAPYDMFLSTDMDWPRRLIREGLAPADAEFVYGVGRIVIWVPHSSSIDVEKLGMQSLLSPKVRKIAIANPRHAPYGRVAMAAMQSMGVYVKVHDRLVLGDSVLQAAQLVESGGADVGIITRSHALAPSMRGKGRFWEVPLDAYPRREQGGVIMSSAQDHSAAEALRDFILGKEGKAVLGRYGFETAGQ